MDAQKGATKLSDEEHQLLDQALMNLMELEMGITNEIYNVINELERDLYDNTKEGHDHEKEWDA